MIDVLAAVPTAPTCVENIIHARFFLLPNSARGRQLLKAEGLANKKCLMDVSYKINLLAYEYEADAIDDDRPFSFFLGPTLNTFCRSAKITTPKTEQFYLFILIL